MDKATIYDALIDHDNLLVFFTSNKLDELKVRILLRYVAIHNKEMNFKNQLLRLLEMSIVVENLSHYLDSVQEMLPQ